MSRLTHLLVALPLALGSLAAGLIYQDQHFRLRSVGQPCDQRVLAHADSAYTSLTWVESQAGNYLQLRFFDKVEGGLSLRPTWGDLQALGKTDPRLAHLVPSGAVPEGAPPAAGWTGPVPDPGTLPNSAYVRFFPAGVLLNDRLMAKANGDLHQAAPKVLIVGLGSSAGILVLAHHLPQAAITVVDIDVVVENAVRQHVPLTRWLETQKTADGSPRLRLVAEDARQFIRNEARRGNHYDLVVLDAYTAGSTIPSHLMTREFFAECATALDDGGLVIGNMIGSYSGEKRQVVGGTLRSFRAAGLVSAGTIPVLTYESAGGFDDQAGRNNIVYASRKPVDPKANPAAWERLRNFVPFPELAPDQWTSATYLLVGNNDAGEKAYITAEVPASAVEAQEPALRARLKAAPYGPGDPRWQKTWLSDDQNAVDLARAAVRRWHAEHASDPTPLGWGAGGDGKPSASQLRRRETDWLQASREVWRVSINAARDASRHSADALVGPVDGPEREAATPNWTITDAPLFTDQMPNADIVNR